ncbi:MAG: PKD domain-containing protein [Bacteroidia bacterium]
MFRFLLTVLLGGFCTHLAFAQCGNYQIYASDSVGCENDIFSFRVHPKTPSGAVLNWDFDVKTVTNDANPTVAFTNTDTLTVSVEIKFSSSQTCNIERKNYIKIGKSPAVNKVFVSDKELCDIGKSAKLTVSAPAAIKHTWSIEGSVYSGSANTVNHTFTKTGYANVQIVSLGDFGCETKKIFDSILFVERKPQIKFGFTDTTLCGASTIQLKPSTNYYGQPKFNHVWVFQGASPSTSTNQQPPKTSYTGTNGSYNVSATLASALTSCQHNYTFTNLVKVQNVPTLNLVVDALNGTGCKSENFGLKATVQGLDSAKLNFFHLSGDSIKIKRINADSAVVTGKHAGTYTVYASYGFSNCTKIVSKKITVQKSDIVADMDRSLPCICNIPSNILITNKSKHANNEPLSFEWELKNLKGKILANSTDTNFRWKADRYGEFELSLKATDSDGCWSQTSFSFKARPFDIEFEASPSSACPQTAIDFKLVDTLCFGELDTVWWTFYDLDKSVRKTHKGQDAVEKYQDTGWYGIKVDALTKEGCRDSIKRDSAVHIIELNGVTATVPNGPFCVGDLVKMQYAVSPSDLVGEWFGVLYNDDTTIYTQKGDSVHFRPPLPGTYSIKVVFTTEECTDSVVFKDAIEVGGVLFDFSPVNTTGCLPFTTNINTTIFENILIGTSDQSINYNWSISPKSRGSFDDDTKKNPTLTIDKLGTIDVSLLVENAQGCLTKLTKNNLFKFDLKADFELPDSFCAGLEYQVVNKSLGSVDTIKWYSDNANFRALPFDSSFSPRFVFEKPGSYTVNLKLKSANGCEENVSKNIEVIDFGFDFTVDDTSTQCSPAPFEFTATGTNVDSFVWDFDDGTDPLITDQNFTLKIYDLIRIGPYRNKFDVRLYGINNIGCVDSIVNLELLTVKGPVPIFNFINNLGCEPLNVQFENKSINAKKVYFDFDDNSSIDSVNYNEHVYNIIDSTQEFMVYKPFIVVQDGQGCQYSYRTPDSILVYSNPVAHFNTNKKQGCAPEVIEFNDTSEFAYKWFWNFGDGNTLSDSLTTASNTYQVGKFKPYLAVENAIGCRDSVFINIDIYEPPQALFNPNEKITCVGRPITFLDSSKTKHQIVKWKWDFGDTLIISDTSQLQNPTYTYDRIDDYDVTLVVIDSNQCADTLVAKNVLEIVSKLQVDTPQILFATVWNDLGVELETEMAEKSIFKRYELQEVETLNDTVETITFRKDTSHLVSGLLPDNNRYCFRLELVDKCDFRHPSDTHCTVLLNVDETQKEVTHLSWSPYVGWPSIQNYQIYRGLAGQALFPLDVVSATQLSYTDSSICNELYEYKVVALKSVDSFLSFSNGVEYQPEYVFQVNPLEMHVATVLNEHVRVSWQKSEQRNVKHYALDRMANDNAWIEDWRFLNDTFIIDSIAKTQTNYYIYRVRAVDACDYNSKKSLIANSILLNASATERDFVLSWNPYKEWIAGVKEYILQRRAPNTNQFVNIAQLGPTDTSFLDTSAFLQFNDAFAYRVFAVENGNKADTSYSNIRVVDPLPTLFVPNAFSPDANGTNDVFNFKSFALLPDSIQANNFELRIYNRWGVQVFLTNNYNSGWDGTFNGLPCAKGSYVYLLKAQGKNGDLIFRKGGITLLR